MVHSLILVETAMPGVRWRREKAAKGLSDKQMEEKKEEMVRATSVWFHLINALAVPSGLMYLWAMLE